jgi:hypothetical protein
MSFLRNLRSVINSWQNPSSPDDDFDLLEIVGATIAPSYRIPKRPGPSELIAQSRKTWVPPEQSVTVTGRTISGGMLYVGEQLAPISGWEEVEPALIDPSLHVDAARGEQGFSYFPSFSYSRSTPEVRSRYLDWLAAGQPANAQLTFPYLKLYALERRILFDARHDETALAELPRLIEEARRLEDRFGGDRYFADNVTELLLGSWLLHGVPSLGQIEPAAIENAWDLPMSIKIGLGFFAKTREPLPAAWAFAWICSDRETNLRTPATRCSDRETNLRTPATRCHEEFQTLFELRYREQFGMGLTLSPPKPRLKVAIRPSNPSFSGQLPIPDPDLPDLTRVRKPQQILRRLVASVTGELDDYSRTIGTSGEKYKPLALAVRPAALGSLADMASLAPLHSVLRDALGDLPMGLVEVDRLVACIPGLSQPPTQKQAVSIGTLAHRLGYGLEPDPGISRKAFIDSKRVGIYRRDPAQDGLRDLSNQQTALSLGALILGVDGTLDVPAQDELLNLVATTFPISIEDTFRLAAYTAWLADHPISFAEIKRQWSQTRVHEYEPFASLVVQLAARDGEISITEMRMLTRIYALFGRTEQQLHLDLHQRFTARSTRKSAGPSPSRASAGQDSTPERGGQTIDPRIVRQVQQQMDDIQAVLGALFSGERAHQELPIAPPAPLPSDSAASADPFFMLISALAERSSCTLAELTALAASFGLMAAGAIEHINERAVDLGFDPAIECDDRCDISADTLRELQAHD